jgi:YD repeat-containing protein
VRKGSYLDAVSAYDAAGNLVSQTDALGNTTSFGYDNLYRRTSQTDANQKTTYYAYDQAGNLKSLTRISDSTRDTHNTRTLNRQKLI